MEVNSPSCSRNLSLSEPARRSMAEHVAPLLKQILERAAHTKGRRYVRRHMEKDIAGDMAGDAPLEGEAPCQSRDTPEGLWLLENPYQSRDTPKGTSACGWSMPEQRKMSKMHGLAERNHSVRTSASCAACHILEGTGRD